MPLVPKSHLHASEKCHQDRGETQTLRGAEASAAAEEECPSSLVSGGCPPSSPAPGPSQEPQEAPGTSSPEAGVSRPGSDEGATGQGEESASTSQAAPSTQRDRKDPLTRKVNKMVQFLLEKYKMNEPVMQAALMKVVKKKYRHHFPDILQRASEHMALIFGLELKEVDHSTPSYALINMLGLPSDGGLGSDKSVPKTGLLMNILALISIRGNSATEEDVWEFLSVLGVYAGKKHRVFGEPKRLISHDLVQQNYLEYRQVPGSDPPRYEFLWGPRAHAETSKMKVLEVLAKMHESNPTAFPTLYEEALRDEEERAAARASARAATTAMASVPSRAKSHSSFRI